LRGLSILILPDLLIFLFHPLGLPRSGAARRGGLALRLRAGAQTVAAIAVGVAVLAVVEARRGAHRDALVVARAAVTQAEENYRIVTKKFEASAATSFDMVDAEALLTQARGQVETALYDALIAQATLKKATGGTIPGAE